MSESRPRRGRVVAILAGIATVVLAVAIAPHLREILDHYALETLEERLQGRWTLIGEDGEPLPGKDLEFLGGGRMIDLSVSREHSFTVEGTTLLVVNPFENPPKTLRVPLSWEGSDLVLEIRDKRHRFRRVPADAR